MAHIEKIPTPGYNYELLDKLRSRVAHSTIRSNVSSYVSRVTGTMVRMGFTEVIGNIGVAMNISSSSDYSPHAKRAIITQVLAKYDPKYAKHIDKLGGYTVYKPGIYVFFPEKNKRTFIYLATGYFIPDFDKKLLMTNGNISNGDMFIFVGGKHHKKYVKEINKVVANSYVVTDLGIITVDSDSYSPPVSMDDTSRAVQESLRMTYSHMDPRSMDTLFFSNNEKEKIISHLNQFVKVQGFYTEHQLLYKTGILLYGTGGVGKSSLCKAIATMYDRDILSINVAHLASIDLDKLSKAIMVDEERTYIVLLEDIDTLFLNRGDKDVSREDNAIINKLLQFLDSNTSPSNVIFIATTNHVDRLDPALLRAGRFDIKVEIRELVEEDLRKFCKYFLLDDEAIDGIINEYAKWASENMYDTESHKDANGNQLYNQSAIQLLIINAINHRNWSISVEDSAEMIIQKAVEEAEKRNVRINESDDDEEGDW